MIQAQIIDADFYPLVVDTHPAVRKGRRGRRINAPVQENSAPVRTSGTQAESVAVRPALRNAALAICAVLLALLAARVFLWNDRRNEVELLTLVNKWNPIEDAGFTPDPVPIGNGQQVDVRCAEALQKMLDDCAQAGYDPLVSSGYRTKETQEQLFREKVLRLTASGLSEKEADAIAATEVARPGTSEHELGLAVDIVDAGHPVLDQSQEKTATQQWLMENCWKYGFILRYPKAASGITGIIYEPWHYRYVGDSAAEQIHQLNITLEEYIALFYSEKGGEN